MTKTTIVSYIAIVVAIITFIKRTGPESLA